MLRAFTEGAISIFFTGIALWLFWKLLPQKWKFICGVGLILVMLYVVSNAIEGTTSAPPAPESAWVKATAPPPAAGAIPRIEATYSLASTVTAAAASTEAPR